MRVDPNHPSEMEVMRETGFSEKSQGSRTGRTVVVLIEGRFQLVTSALAKLLRSIWAREEVPKGWCESVIVTIYKKEDRSSCEDHIASKLHPGIIFRGFSSTPERLLRENQADFIPGRICTDHVFRLPQKLKQRHVFCRPTVQLSQSCNSVALLLNEGCSK